MNRHLRYVILGFIPTVLLSCLFIVLLGWISYIFETLVPEVSQIAISIVVLLIVLAVMCGAKVSKERPL